MAGFSCTGCEQQLYRELTPTQLESGLGGCHSCIVIETCCLRLFGGGGAEGRAIS